MKILMLCMDSCDYKAPSHEILVAEEIAKLGNEVTLVCERHPFGYPENKPINITYHTMPINGVLSEQQISFLNLEKYDITFASSVPGAKYVNRIAKDQGIKSVVQVLDVPTFRIKFKHWFDQWMGTIEELKKSDILVVNTKKTVEVLDQLSHGELTDRTTVIYYGIATDNADAIKVEQKENHIAWCSGIRWYKGLELVLFALKTMKNPPKLKVIGAGDKTEWEINGEIPFRLIQLASHLGLDVEFLGGIGDPEKFEIIKKAKLSVMIDISECIATMFVLESIYCGTPCISSDMPICRDRYGDTPLYLENNFDTGTIGREIENALNKIDVLNDKAQHDKLWISENRSFKSQAIQLHELFKQNAR